MHELGVQLIKVKVRSNTLSTATASSTTSGLGTTEVGLFIVLSVTRQPWQVDLEHLVHAMNLRMGRRRSGQWSGSRDGRSSQYQQRVAQPFRPVLDCARRSQRTFNNSRRLCAIELLKAAYAFEEKLRTAMIEGTWPMESGAVGLRGSTFFSRAAAIAALRSAPSAFSLAWK